MVLFERAHGMVQWDEDLLINGRSSLETLVRVVQELGKGQPAMHNRSKSCKFFILNWTGCCLIAVPVGENYNAFPCRFALYNGFWGLRCVRMLANMFLKNNLELLSLCNHSTGLSRQFSKIWLNLYRKRCHSRRPNRRTNHVIAGVEGVRMHFVHEIKKP